MSDIEIPPTGLLPETPTEERDGPREKTPREFAMERIAANAERVRQDELAQAAVYDQDARDAGLAFQDDEQVETAPEPVTPHRTEGASPPEPSIKETGPAPTPAPQTFAIDLDGQQLHVTQEQLLALGRMGAIANRELYRYQTQPQQFQPGPVVQAPSSPPQPVLDQDLFGKTVKAIQYGDEATATHALSELVSHVVARSPQAPQIDAVAIGNYAAQKARLEARLEHETQIIRTEYADIMGDPDLAHLAAMKVQQLRQRNQSLGQHQSDLDVYREAGNLVLDKIGKPRPGQQVDHQPGETGTTAPQAPNIVVRRAAGEIDARKRAAPRAMSQVIDRRSPAPQAPRHQTPSEIVENMRKARGLTSMR